MIKRSVLSIALVLTACGQGPPGSGDEARQQAPSAPPAPVAEAPALTAASRIAEVLAAQPAETQARYAHRHPQETLAFFGIEPGLTLVEALPGAGWYSKILVDVLGPTGHLIGADYAMEMWPKFGFFDAAFIEGKKTWTQEWTEQAEAWRGPDSATVSAFVLGSLPETMKGTADAVLFVRALHNLNRFEADGGFLSAALADAYAACRAGCSLGVVQHRAPESSPDEWADGSRGYLKKDAVIAMVQQAGFEFVAESDINANPKDQPTEEDVVWRLPPTLVTSREDAALRAEMEAIGESSRMTLLFRKPD